MFCGIFGSKFCYTHWFGMPTAYLHDLSGYCLDGIIDQQARWRESETLLPCLLIWIEYKSVCYWTAWEWKLSWDVYTVLWGCQHSLHYNLTFWIWTWYVVRLVCLTFILSLLHKSIPLKALIFWSGSSTNNLVKCEQTCRNVGFVDLRLQSTTLLFEASQLVCFEPFQVM